MMTIIRGDKVVTLRPTTVIGYVQRSNAGLAVYDSDHEWIGTAGGWEDAVIAVEIAAGLRAAPCSTCGSFERVTMHHPADIDQSVDICATCGSDE